MKKLISGLLLVAIPYLFDLLGIEVDAESLNTFVDILATAIGALLLILAPSTIKALKKTTK